MKMVIVLAGAGIMLAGCGSSLADQARDECISQGQEIEAQLAAAGVELDEYCACATEGLTAADAQDQGVLAQRAQQCISDAMSGNLSS
ncbi:MAG: hypothetical protein RLN87_07835 [Parasphingopyxis sp.]|uniref:hypothetical protein n=1 Tax=Parasphingopyxis sp. TaxID=1920299 RepID=UPI00262D94DA|nr:hypothetical protein [uncultured Parasphingopyxis sp.]